MSPVVTPTPPEILGWMRGFAATYLDHHAHPALSETARDHAGSALVNFNVHVMAIGAEEGRFFGVDRLRIAREIVEASADGLAEWELRIELIDPLWKKGLCRHLNSAADAFARGAAAVFGVEPPPAWIDDVLSSGLFAFPDVPTVPAGRQPPRVLLPTEARFLEKSLHDAVGKSDTRTALGVLSRIAKRKSPETTIILRRIASEFLSGDRIQAEASVERRLTLSESGRRALLALARRSDPEALNILGAILQGEKVLFDETAFGPQSLPLGHPLVSETVAQILLVGDYGFEGQHVLEQFLVDQSYVLPEGEELLETVLKYRSGRLFLKLFSKNPWMDRIVRRSALRDARFYVTAFHLHLLEPIARAGRSEALRWLLRRPDLLRAVREAPPRVKDRAVQSLISIYHQIPGEGDREAVADLMEETGHESAVAFFKGEILRLGRTRSLSERVRAALGVGLDRRDLLQARIDRMRARRDSRSA